MIRELIFGKKYWIIRHIIFWLTLYLEEFLSLFGIIDTLELGFDFLLSFLLDMILVYINIYFFLPKLLMKGKIGLYILITALSLLTISGCNFLDTLIRYGDDFEYAPGDWFYYIYDGMVYTLSVLATAVAIKTAKIIYEKGKIETALIKQKTDAEISALKQQVNPHFLFNSLNNLYILAKTKNDALPDQLLKLSDLMRYQTYDASKEKIILGKEIEFLKNYLALEKIRRNDLKVSVDVDPISKHLSIQPLLFLPFVENAAKHSYRTDGQIAEISLSWKVQDEHLIFVCENSQGNGDIEFHAEDSGAGLENIKTRLELLYPDQYRLDIQDQKENYTVRLAINRLAI